MTTETTGTADQATLFGPDSQFSGFFDDPRWALAMIRATVLEAAHPQVGAALADNSTFVTHPWRPSCATPSSACGACSPPTRRNANGRPPGSTGCTRA